LKESTVEKYLREQVEARGGMCEKFTSPGRRDVPDRLISWPFSDKDLAETKATGKKPRPGQLRDHARRKRIGHQVYVLDSKEAVDWYINQREWRKICE
jgi:hypothetical protein